MTNKIETEFIDIDYRSVWAVVYQSIGRECQNYPYTCIEAKKAHNKPLNRYRDVNPYDHSRIILKRFEKDYINANLVKMDRAQRKYILTQGPLNFTVSHFWLMVWEQDSRAILMLNKIVEKNEIKCHWYWPQALGEEHKLTFNDVKLSVEQIEEEDCGYYRTRVFRIYDMETEQSREVIQFHYTTWPDFGVPSSPFLFLDFLKKVRASGALEPDVGPAVVHCSAGIGRSGTFCLVDSCLVIVEKEGCDSVDIKQILLEMRKDRMGLIQTPDQLRFSYLAIIEGIKRLDPDWVEEENVMEEVVCGRAQVEEEAPPPPPPRAESLTRAPARPLPAIPTSTSLGNMAYPVNQEESSDEGPPTPPVRESSSSVSSADDDDDEPAIVSTESGGEAAAETGAETGAGAAEASLRRRRTRELADRVSAMKRRARDADKWHALKRSLYKPLAITFGMLLAGIVVYAYVKH